MINEQVCAKAKEVSSGMMTYVQSGNQFGVQDKALVRWIVETYQPYSSVDNKYFRAMIKAYNPTAKRVTQRKPFALRLLQ